MTHMKLKFRETKQILNFVNLIKDCAFDADIRYGHIVVDAKSLMGVMAVASNKEVELILHASEENSQTITSRLTAFAA